MNVLKSFQSNKFIQFALLVAVVYFLYTYMNKETLENVAPEDQMAFVPQAPQVPQVPQAPEVQGMMVSDMEQQQQIDQIVAGKEQLKAEELLPKYDDQNEFAKQNPVSKLLKEQNFLISGYHVGINTVMQSNKIPYHDIRSVPPIPKESVGPWSQSSYETPVGSNRRQLEIS